MPPAGTIVSLFQQRVAASSGSPALHVWRDDRFQVLTWEQFAGDVRRTAAGLVRLGLEPGDRVVLLSENRYEWLVCDLAIQLAQAVSVPIHATLTGPQIAWQVRHSGARLVILSGSQQAAKLTADGIDLPPVLWLTFDNCPPLDDRKAPRLPSLLAASGDEESRRVEQQALAAIQPQTPASILYTSGTTGEPKGVVLSQGNLAFNAHATWQAFDRKIDELRLNFLPLSHIFARTCDLYTWIVAGSQLALARRRETILEDCGRLRPTIINGVPYFYNLVARHLQQQRLADQPGSLGQCLGGRIRFCNSGGAALPEHLFDFFHQRGVPLLEGYGLTESSPVITLSTREHVRRGAVGRALPGVELKVAADGEILSRGPHVMSGYYEDAQSTRRVLRDGWLHTGDLGRIDQDGYLFITGRKKELIVTATGKSVVPACLEGLLTQDPLILQAVVVGDGRNCLAALIVPQPDQLRGEIIARRIPVTSAAEALVHPQVRALYEQSILRTLHARAPHEQIRKFTLLGRGFTIESGELTPKLSLRRHAIEASFRDQIEAMFQGP